MHHSKSISLALLISGMALACTQNRKDERRAGEDSFPNSNTTVPTGDRGFQAGTVPSPLNDEGMRFQGREPAESPCDAAVRPGDDVGSIDPECPDDTIKPLVPLSTPTPLERERMQTP